MKVLLTRPAEDAARTADQVSRRGHEPIIAPVFEIRFLTADIPQRSYQAVLATSANAMRSIGQRVAIDTVRGLPLIAVGDATAEAARQAGFSEIASAGGAADDLRRFVQARLDPAAGPLLYLSGTEVASDLSVVFAGEGYEVVRVVLYEAQPVPDFPAAAKSALQHREIHAVLVYSPRSAKLLGALADRAGISKELASATWVCLSPAVAEAARNGGAERVLVAERPDEAALLQALEVLSLATAPPKRV